MENWAQILLNTIEDGVCGVNRQGLVCFANPAAARILGAEPESLLRKTVHELFHGCAPENQHSNCELRRIAGNSRIAGEDTVYAPSGRSFRAEYVLTPILEQGRFSGSVLTFRDISPRFALDLHRDELISTASHELRAPLTSICGALGLLAGGMLGDVSEKAAGLLQIALANSDRMLRLVNEILDLERIESGRKPLLFRPLQLAEIVRQAVDGMQPVADAAGVNLAFDAAQVEITADPDRLLQVLTNLLSNAIKFSPPESTVWVLLRAGPTGVTLSVVDQGCGIPADKLDVIFERFQQVAASDSRSRGGSGLGLAISRTIVQQHSGRIWAEQNPVCGSTFQVFLPYHPTGVEVPEESSSEAMVAAGAQALRPSNNLITGAFSVEKPACAFTQSRSAER
jgi:PAS domain S-box-containing protein